MVISNETRIKRADMPALLAASLIPALLAAHLVFTSGWSISPTSDPYDGKRIFELVIISFSLLFGLVYRPLRLQLLSMIEHIPVPIQLAIACVFVFGVVSALASNHTFYGLTEVCLYFSLFALILFTAASAQLLGDRMMTLVAVFLLILGSIISFTELIGLLVHWKLGQTATSHTLFLRFSHPRFFNQVQSWLLPLMILPILVFSGRKFIVGLAFFNLAFWWALLIYSGGRGSLLGLVCAFGFVFLLVFNKPPFRQWRLTQLVAIMTGIGIYLLMMLVPNMFGGETGDALAGSVGRSISHTSGRFEHWLLVLQQLADQPILGSGPGLSLCSGTVTYFAHPHNFYLQVIGEWGVPAGLATATTIIYVIQATIRHLYPRLNKSDSVLIVLVATGALAAGIHAMFSGVMVMPASQVSCVLVLGFFTALVLKPPGDSTLITTSGRPATVNPVVAAVLLLPVIFAVAQLNYFMFNEVPKLDTRANTFIENHGVQYAPRLWAHGHICSYPGQNP